MLYPHSRPRYTFNMKRFLHLAASFLVFLSVFFIASSCTTTYLGRYLAWGSIGGPEMQDKFPSRAIDCGDSVYEFTEDFEKGKAYGTLFTDIEYLDDKKNPVQTDLETFFAESETAAFIVIKDDTIIFEWFKDGIGRETVLPSFSMSKSVTSALIGIAIDESLIESVRDPIALYLPEYDSPKFADLQVEHLLAMNSGFKHSLGFAPWSDFVRSYFDPDLRKVALTQKFKYPPGSFFTYNNSNTQLLGIILEQTTGLTPSAYLEEKIWKRIGTEHPTRWSMDSEKSGFEQMASGLYARPLDYARFGRLFLRRGNWEGKQIISEDWVKKSTAPDAAGKDPAGYYDLRKKKNNPYYDYFMNEGGYYGYQWWGYTKATGVPNDFYASGMFGQFIYISPGKNAIILRFGSDTAGVYSWSSILRDIADLL
jgi:CubicO group peptidase (beta-lactamase class C family)